MLILGLVLTVSNAVFMMILGKILYVRCRKILAKLQRSSSANKGKQAKGEKMITKLNRKKCNNFKTLASTEYEPYLVVSPRCEIGFLTTAPCSC